MASVLDSITLQVRQEAVAVFQAAVEAVQPAPLVQDFLHSRSHSGVLELDRAGKFQLPLPVTVVGAGKAAAAMARGCELALGAGNVTGDVISTDGTAAELTSIRLHRASHPLPDERGVTATRALLRRVQGAVQGPVLCLISGGTSSLLVCPRHPLTLAEKIETNQLLLDSGAPIEEVNTVRKHLSEVKGGGFLRHSRVPLMTLLISDVVGDDPAVIGSGPTAADPTTFADAWTVVCRYGLQPKLPTAVRQILEDGLRGKVAETVKPESAEARRGDHAVIGSNRLALQGAARLAMARGWEVIEIDEPLVGDTTAAAGAFGRELKRLTAQGSGGRRCVLAGGETTVQVRGPGRGGRNQEFALALAEQIEGTRCCVLSAGTDGIDGPTDAAGAFVDGSTAATARQMGLDPRAALARNDAYSFFQAIGGLWRCGPTGTNVMDIKVALITEG